MMENFAVSVPPLPGMAAREEVNGTPATAGNGRRSKDNASPGIVSILDVPFSALSHQQAVERIGGMLKSGQPHHVVLANAHTLNLAYTDEQYRRVLQRAALVLRDGLGVELAALALRSPLADNFVGTDFVPYLLEQLAHPQVRIFLYGAAPGVALQAADTLRRRCPAIRIAGVEHGYVDREDVVLRIQALQPDVLLVALGNPLQEQWIAAHLSELNARVAIGVGALFDYLAGRVPRAPEWVRRFRGEWVFRLSVEPNRLWRRYLIGNAQFLWRTATTLSASLEAHKSVHQHSVGASLRRLPLHSPKGDPRPARPTQEPSQ